MAKEATQLKIVTLRQQPDLADAFWPVKQAIWPEFMFHDLYADKYWHYTYEVFDEFQIYLLNEAGEPVAVGQTIPCTWDGTREGLPVGWADSLVRGATDHEVGRAPNTLVALEIAIHPEYRGQGVSYQMLNAIRTLAKQHEFQAVIVAVRPSLKSKYPLTPMERYIRWQQEDGAPFDPWLRVHWRLGAEILHVAHPSMVVEGTADEWEAWTGLQFPESGDYVIPGALVPIHIDREMNVGRYIEPNVWVHHPLTTNRLHP
jgi:GNAT superfamily N-acetyltransferase